jgi:hypothetical protein
MMTFSLPVLSPLLGRQYLEKTVRDQLIRLFKPLFTSSLITYRQQFNRWSEQVIWALERRYEDVAARYRANLARLRNGTAHDSDEARNIENGIALIREPMREIE